MNKAAPFVVAFGIAMMALPTAYHFAPEKEMYIPAPKTVQAEVLVPVVVHKPVPKAVVKPDKKKPPKQKTGREGHTNSRAKEGDFTTDLRSLQNCKKLDDLRRSGKQVETDYQARLRNALIPWYLRNCILT